MYSHARTGMKFGLQELKISSGDNILIPEYICEAVLQPLRSLSIRWQYYQITDKFSPIWSDLHQQVDQRTRAILMVHYFGQPQELNQYFSFCKEYDLLLIEDNAHGHGGRVNNRLLGTFGDLGISSPRKLAGTETGGILYVSGSIEAPSFGKLQPQRVLIARSVARSIIEMEPHRKVWLRKLFRRMPQYDSPSTFVESTPGDWQVDKTSKKVIENQDWDTMAKIRRQHWYEWHQFSKERGLLPIWESPSAQSCPWAIPVYAQSLSERNRWLEWSWKHGLGLFPWPSLPQELIMNNRVVLERWRKLLCFPLDKTVPRDI